MIKAAAGPTVEHKALIFINGKPESPVTGRKWDSGPLTPSARSHSSRARRRPSLTTTSVERSQEWFSGDVCSTNNRN